MLKLSICKLFARPSRTWFAHLFGKIDFLLFCAPFGGGAKQQEKIYFSKQMCEQS